jgi:phytanoyl-CoA hydroxylase
MMMSEIDQYQLVRETRIDVPKMLSAGQVKQFVDQGFLVMPNLVDPVEVDEMRRDIVSLARGRYTCDALPPKSEALSDEDVLRSVLCIHEPHHVSPVILNYVKHQKICGVLSQVTGAHLAHWNGNVKCMQSMFFVKPPGFQGQAWHQDEIYIPTRDRSLIGAWIALDDATVENGCLWVVPGSHRPGLLYAQRNTADRDEFDGNGESFGFDESLEIPVEVKTGSVVFFNGYLLHRSKRNRSKTCYRRALVNHYMTAESFLPWQIREGESPANADRRDVVHVAGVDPYAHKGYEIKPGNVWLRTCKANEAPAGVVPV